MKSVVEAPEYMNLKNSLNAHSSAVHVHPSVFMLLIIPFGIVGGYVTVTLAFLMARAGIPLEKITPLIGMSLFPNIFKFLWAPVVDTTLTNKKWYILSNFITATGILLIGMLTMREENLMLMGLLIFLISFASTFSVMAASSLMVYDTPNELIGRAGGWMNAGYLGGAGIGGGVGLWIAEKTANPLLVGFIILIICVLCSFGLIKLREPNNGVRDKKYVKSLRNVSKDIWEVVKSRMGFFALFLCFLPIGSGAASNLWSAISNDWGASAKVVALVVGLAGGLLSAIGSLMGGWICDKIDRKRAYILFGLLQATIAVMMAYAPRTELMFILGTSFYAVSSGLIYAGFSAFTLEAIGKGAVATKYNVFASFSYIPIYFMIYIDEWAHKKWSAFGMLNIEAAMGLFGVLLFSIVFIINQLNVQKTIHYR